MSTRSKNLCSKLDLQKYGVKRLVTFEFDSAEDYTKFNQDIVAPIRTMLSNETDTKREQVWNDVTEQAKLKYSDHDSGHVKFVNEAIWIVGVNT